MGECKDCKHWGDAGGWNIDHQFKDTHKCCALTVAEGTNPKNGKTLAHAMDAEGYAAVLITLPSFGCNQFELK
jgi:hypothetical protein